MPCEKTLFTHLDAMIFHFPLNPSSSSSWYEWSLKCEGERDVRTQGRKSALHKKCVGGWVVALFLSLPSLPRQERGPCQKQGFDKLCPHWLSEHPHLIPSKNFARRVDKNVFHKKWNVWWISFCAHLATAAARMGEGGGGGVGDGPLPLLLLLLKLSISCFSLLPTQLK